MKSDKFRLYTIIAIGINILSFGAIIFSSYLIPIIAPSRPPLNDLLFQLTPHVYFASYLTQTILAFAIVTTTVYILPKRKNILPQLLAAIGIMELIRAFILILTPLGLPEQEAVSFSIPLAAYGPFPSGHTAFIYMCYLFIDKKDDLVKNSLLLLLIGEIVFLILSRGHYSIDIIGGLLLSYAVYKVIKFQKLFEIN